MDFNRKNERIGERRERRRAMPLVRKKPVATPIEEGIRQSFLEA